MSKFEIVWSKEAEADLNAIYEHYLTYAPENANNRVLQIILATEELVFPEQWQVDEIDSASRRIIVDKRFRVVYREVGSALLITRVYPTKKLR